MKAIKENFKKNRKSFVYAWAGIKTASKENNFRIQLIAAVLITVLGLYTGLETVEWIILLVLIGIVLSAEIFNTALEHMVDLLSPEKKPLAGSIKDLAAGAVLVLAILSFVIGLIIFLPKYL